MLWHSPTIPYWRLSSFYFIYFGFLGVWLPFWNLYLESYLHFSAVQIGIISALMLGSKIFSAYLWGWLADITGSSLGVIRVGLLLACISFSFLLWSTQFLTVVFLIGLYSFFWHAVLSPFEVITLSYLKAMPYHYTQVRVWGSIGFIVAVVGLGYLLDYLPIRLLPSMLLVLLLLLLVNSFLLKEPLKTPTEVKANQQARLFWQTLKQGPILALFTCCLLMQLSHGPYYTFYSIYLENLGYSRSQIGWLWSLGVFAEVALFIAMPRIFQRYTARNLLLLTFFLSSVRWLMIAWFANNIYLLLLAQLLHAASFASFHALVIDAVRRHFHPHSSGQGQAFYGMVYGIGGALGALISGFLWPLGSQLLFSLAASATLLALVITWLYIDKKSLNVKKC